MSFRSVIAGRGSVIIGLDASGLKRGARMVQRDLDRLGGKMQGFGRIAAGIGAATAAPMAIAVKSFADFDDAMRAVGAVAQASQSDLAKLTDTAKNLGATTSFAAIDVANLMTELGRAGFNPTQIDSMTGAVLDLARATGTDASMAASTMAASIRQFGLGANDATRVADVLTVAANKSFNSVETLSESLSYAGTVAADFGMSIEETAAILGTLGNVGIQGSNAGTALRRLLTLTGAEAEKLKGIFGVSFVDAAGNARPLVDTLAEVAQATNGLGTAARSAKFNEAFGLLGITGASAIGNAAAETKNLLSALQGAGGAASKAAKEMDAGIGGSFRKIMSAADGVQLAIGDALEEPLQRFTDQATTGLSAVSQFIDQNQGLVISLAAGSAALVGIGGGLLAAGTAASVASMAVGGLATTVGLLTSPVALVTAGIGGLGYVILTQTEMGGKAIDWLSGRFEALVESVGLSVEGIKAAIEAGDYAAAWDLAVNAMELTWLDLTSEIRDAWTRVSTFIVNVSAGVTEQVGVMFQSLGEFLGSLLEGYQKYYDAVFNTITKKVGELSGVATIGEQGSAFESNFGGAKKAMEARIAGIIDFGKQLETKGQGDREANTRAGAKELSDRQQRLDAMRANVNTQASKEIGKGMLRDAGEGVGSLLDGLKKMVATEATKNATDASGRAAAALGGTSSAGDTTGGPATFSAMGSLLLGMGSSGPMDRTAKASEKQVGLLQSIDASIKQKGGGGPGFGLSDLGAATVDGVQKFADDPLGTVQSGGAMIGDLAGSMSRGIADAFAGQSLFQFGASGDPGAKTPRDAKGDKALSDIATGIGEIVRNTRDPIAARLA
ncbi:Phage-related minor tail protein [Stieleria maiorica]|uniref:Phage-related minor tail protein n=1 Tax=Stieleria maiorica TaxID=2795974 RepID=A0A5B9MJG5_9BACT|nr:phage tail tape measure protein [Stieleria maiorica]QEF99745.1 Phage-related minor tail protein [Stieleria maiorica]